MAVRAPDGAKLVILHPPGGKRPGAFQAKWISGSPEENASNRSRPLTSVLRPIGDFQSRTRALPGESARGGRSVVVVMNDGLAFGAVTMLLLDDGGAVARFMLPDDRAIAIAIAVVIPVTLADGYAGANGTNANANLIRQGRAREGAYRRGNNQNLLHLCPPSWNGIPTAHRPTSSIGTCTKMQSCVDRYGTKGIKRVL